MTIRLAIYNLLQLVCWNDPSICHGSWENSLKDIRIVTLAFWGHVMSSATSPFDYQWYIVKLQYKSKMHNCIYSRLKLCSLVTFNFQFPFQTPLYVCLSWHVWVWVTFQRRWVASVSWGHSTRNTLVERSDWCYLTGVMPNDVPFLVIFIQCCAIFELLIPKVDRNSQNWVLEPFLWKSKPLNLKISKLCYKMSQDTRNLHKLTKFRGNW